MRAIHWLSYISLISISLASSCGKPDSDLTSSAFETPATYFSTMTDLSMEVVYEPGAEPYTGEGFTGGQLWEFIQKNLDGIFKSRSQNVRLHIPKSLGEMRQIPTQNRSRWNTESLIELTRQERRRVSTAFTASFFIVFLEGFFEDAELPSQSVVAVSISGTSIIAIFKPIVRSAGVNDPVLVPRYMEQSTIAHEMGHALGLVNNGLPLATPHQDMAHGAHCINPRCIMYWLNEGPNNAASFVREMILSGNENVFGGECLRDIQAYRP